METIKLQDKLQEIKDEIARKYDAASWLNIQLRLYFGDLEADEFDKIENEAMIAFAAYCCERQRESDAEAAETKTVNPGYMEMDVVDKSSILNNKLITDEL